MAWFQRLLGAALILLGVATSGGARAQIPDAIQADPAALVTKVSLALQTGDLLTVYRWFDSDLVAATLSRTGGTAIDSRLAALGRSTDVTIEDQRSSPLEREFSARVVHAKGTASWKFRIDRTIGRFKTADLSILPVTAKPPAVVVSASLPSRSPAKPWTYELPDSVTTDFLQDAKAPMAHASTSVVLRSPSSVIASVSRLQPALDPAPRPVLVERVPEARPVIIPLPGPVVAAIAPNAGQAADPTPGSAVPVVPSARIDTRVVDLLFVTTRKEITPPPGSVDVSFSGERGDAVSYGAASVRIPDDRKVGRIDLSLWERLRLLIVEGTSTAQRKFELRRTIRLTKAQWDEAIQDKAASTALVFVHGFGNSFEDSLFRTAQIVWDMQYPGLAVTFSWASRGSMSPQAYGYDRDSADIARTEFVNLLRDLKATRGIEKVHVIAHSMGNRLVLDALASHSQTANPIRIDELISAAPDVDRDLFKQIMPNVKGVSRGMTLYASSADKAMWASRAAAGSPRAGDVPPDGPVVLPSLDTIDVTAIGEEFFGLNHSEFAANRELINDMKLIISLGLHPPTQRLATIRGFPPASPQYWKVMP